MKIVITSVLVDDQQNALDFYTDALGFTKKEGSSHIIVADTVFGGNSNLARAQQTGGFSGINTRSLGDDSVCVAPENHSLARVPGRVLTFFQPR